MAKKFAIYLLSGSVSVFLFFIFLILGIIYKSLLFCIPQFIGIILMIVFGFLAEKEDQNVERQLSFDCCFLLVGIISIIIAGVFIWSILAF